MRGRGRGLHSCIIVFFPHVQTALENLINTGRYDTSDDFTVVLQPFPGGIELPYQVIALHKKSCDGDMGTFLDAIINEFNYCTQSSEWQAR